jgi:hypothetical protein
MELSGHVWCRPLKDAQWISNANTRFAIAEVAQKDPEWTYPSYKIDVLSEY